jgi:hypothetical protein
LRSLRPSSVSSRTGMLGLRPRSFYRQQKRGTRVTINCSRATIYSCESHFNNVASALLSGNVQHSGRHWIGKKGGAILRVHNKKDVARFHVFLKPPITRKRFCMSRLIVSLQKCIQQTGPTD